MAVSNAHNSDTNTFISNSFKDFMDCYSTTLSFKLFRDAEKLLYIITQNTPNLVIFF